ncbi:hypothetical protein M422DRAFT_38107, partial [Sphaerobolus stellatus SS14]
MQFSIVALLSLASVAFASPISLHLIRSCDAGKCAVALGPAAVGCLAAGVQIGVDPIADAGCVAGVVDSAVNTSRILVLDAGVVLSVTLRVSS